MMTPGFRMPVGSSRFLDRAHQPVSVASPFHLDERRHVAAGAVLRLQRAVILLDHQFADIVHEGGIALHFRIDGEILGEDEMQVAVQGVPENDRLVVAVLIEKRLKVQRRRSRILDPESHVLDDHGGSGAAHGPDGGEQALADLLAELVGDRRGRGGRQRRDAVKNGGDFRDLGFQAGFVLGRTSTSRAVAVAEPRISAGMPGLSSTDRSAARSISSTAATGRLQQRHGAAGLSDAGEEQQALALWACSGTVR